MGFRFQRRVRVLSGLRLNLSKSGVGVSVGRTGLRLGIDANREKYLSVGLPGSGLSYRTFFGRPVPVETLKNIVYILAATLIAALAVIATRQ
jgi:Protein of unknown function (DUF4236)